MLSVWLRPLSEVFDYSRKQSQTDLNTSAKSLFESPVFGL